MMTALPAEIELLRGIAHLKLSDDDKKSIESLLADIQDKSQLCDLASAHGLLPFLYLHSQHFTDWLKPIQPKINSYFFQISFHNLQMAQYLAKLHSALTRASIPMLAYKGLALAASAYGNLCLRQFSDLDTIIPEEEIFYARDVLINEGYQPKFDIIKKHEPMFLRSNHALSMSHPAGFDIELHWQVVPEIFCKSFRFEEVYSRKKEVSIQGEIYPTFSDEDMLVSLCIHAAKHCWERMSMLSDIGETIAQSRELDWAYISNIAAEKRTTKMVLSGVELASRYLYYPMPAAMKSLIGNDSSLQNVNIQIKMLQSEEQTKTGVFFRFWPHIAMMDSFFDKVRYWLRLVCVPTIDDFRFVELPERLNWLYPALRPFRLFIALPLLNNDRMKKLRQRKIVRENSAVAQ